MKTITLVTGNEYKLKEWQRLFPKSITLASADVDLEEMFKARSYLRVLALALVLIMSLCQTVSEKHLGK